MSLVGCGGGIMGAQQTEKQPPMLFLFVGPKTATHITMVWELKS